MKNLLSNFITGSDRIQLLSAYIWRLSIVGVVAFLSACATLLYFFFDYFVDKTEWSIRHLAVLLTAADFLAIFAILAFIVISVSFGKIKEEK